MNIPARATICAALLSPMTCVCTAGDLAPPAGPVAPTMKTLDDVQPWTPLSDVPAGPGAVHLITEPGVYFMTEELSVGAGDHGIQISLNGLPPGEYYVCIVSNGFPIRLGPGSLDGIHYTDGVGHDETIEICSGHPQNIISPISGAGGSGVHLEGADRVAVSGLHVTNCGGDGVHVVDNRVAHCTGLVVRGCGGDGIETVAALSGSYVCRKLNTWNSVSQCGGDAVRIVNYHDVRLEDLNASDCMGNGALVHPRAFVGGSGTATARITMVRCIVSSHTLNGVDAETQTPGTYKFELEVVDALGNSGNGISFLHPHPDTNVSLSMDGFDASSNGLDGVVTTHNSVGGISNARLTNGSMHTNGGDGKKVKGGPIKYIAIHMEDCIIHSNGDSGVHVLPDAGSVDDEIVVEMDACTSSGNGAHGVHFNWNQTNGPFRFDLEGCQLSTNTLDGLRAIDASGCGIDNNCNSNGGGGTVVIGGAMQVTGGTFNKNGSDGFRSENSSCWVRVSQASGNSGDGFHVVDIAGLPLDPFRLEQAAANGNVGRGVYTLDVDAELLDVSANGNESGVVFGGSDPSTKTPTFRWVRCVDNAFQGISVGNAVGGTIRDSVCSGNGEYGIWCLADANDGVIQGNHCSANLGGIRVDGTQNVVQQNTATFGVLGGVSVAAGNLTGLPVDAATINTHSNPAGNVEK